MKATNEQLTAGGIVNPTPKREDRLFLLIASACGARKRCLASGNEYAKAWDERLDAYEELLPSGSGVDSGCKIDRDESGDEKIVIKTAFHHMDDNGMYCGWTEHNVIVTPSFIGGFSVQITGRDKRGIKDYLHELFANDLDLMAPLCAPSETIS